MNVSRATLVLDAGALHAVPANRSENIILTPHHGEMASLLGCSKCEVAARPAELALHFAREHRVTVVLKGATTWVATPSGELLLHEGGTAGLGTSGSGDTLAGLLIGLIARGATSAEACAWAVFIHALAGQFLDRQVGPIGYLSRELPGQFPALLERMSQKKAAARKAPPRRRTT
jgi:hydroxyethylthiazole kinase-like uncharacterized protein yjeF